MAEFSVTKKAMVMKKAIAKVCGICLCEVLLHSALSDLPQFLISAVYWEFHCLPFQTSWHNYTEGSVILLVIFWLFLYSCSVLTLRTCCLKSRNYFGFRVYCSCFLHLLIFYPRCVLCSWPMFCATVTVVSRYEPLMPLSCSPSEHKHCSREIQGSCHCPTQCH